MISIIAAIGKNNELGKDNELVFHIKEDMQFFKNTTTNHSVVMGKKTFNSIGKPLPNRTNYVVTHHPENLPKEIKVISDLNDFLEKNKSSEEEVFIIGGATIYQTALPYAKRLYLTEVDKTAPADTFFPTFNQSDYTKTILKKGTENDLKYQIVCYQLND